MAETVTRLPVKTESLRASALQAWQPLGSFRREIDRLFDDFVGSGWGTSLPRSGLDIEPFRRREMNWGTAPAVDIAESDKAFEITADLPGMDEKNVEVTLTNDSLTIKGEKHEDKEERNKDYYLQERRFGSFERCFRLPEGVDRHKIDANFKKGVLTVTLPKTAEALRSEKKITIKAA